MSRNKYVGKIARNNKHSPSISDICFMGIDQSLTHTGLTIIRSSLNHFKIADVVSIRTTPDLSDEERIFVITNQIERAIKRNVVDFISIEGLAYGVQNTNTGRVLAGLFFSILTTAIRLDRKYTVIPPKTLKKFATNNGSAEKIEMINAIPKDDLITLEKQSSIIYKVKLFEDISDSYWLARYGFSLEKKV